MNNPLHDDARYALFPHPPRCTGHRVFCMLVDGCAERGRERPRRDEYLAAFDRRNVLHARAWCPRAAKAAAPSLRRSLGGRRVVVLGVATLAALCLPRDAWGAWRTHAEQPDLLSQPCEFTYCLVPHPSGLCREYNDPAVFGAVAALLAAEYERWRGLQSASGQTTLGD